MTKYKKIKNIFVFEKSYKHSFYIFIILWHHFVTVPDTVTVIADLKAVRGRGGSSVCEARGSRRRLVRLLLQQHLLNYFLIPVQDR